MLKSKLDISIKNILVPFISGMILAFGIYNIHSLCDITEGGIIGLVLLLEALFNISPAISELILDIICYGLGFKIFGIKFIVSSLFGTIGFSISYKICELFNYLWPQLFEMPLLASLLGALFVGIPTGIAIRNGAALGADDALCMSISKLTNIKINYLYLITDGIVLTFSLLYIPFNRMWYSIITVILSGQIIGIIKDFKLNSSFKLKSK